MAVTVALNDGAIARVFGITVTMPYVNGIRYDLVWAMHAFLILNFAAKLLVLSEVIVKNTMNGSAYIRSYTVFAKIYTVGLSTRQSCHRYQLSNRLTAK